MKIRLTFFHDAAVNADWSPAEKLKVGEKSLSLKDLKTSAREDHVMLDTVKELPEEIIEGLKGTDDLHIRWHNPRAVTTIDPLGSRLPAGLHVFYSPKAGSKAEETNICPLLRKLFNGITKCESPSKTFNKLEVESTSATSSLQYYQLVHNASSLADYVQAEVCTKKAAGQYMKVLACNGLVDAIKNADVLDVDYQQQEKLLTLRATRFQPKKDLALVPALPYTRIEVGILSAQEDAPGGAEEDEDVKLSYGGFLTRVGEDLKESPTLFSFPSRQHTQSTPYEVGFNSPTGLHPTMRISFPNGTPEPPANTVKADQKKTSAGGSRKCSLHAQLSLPSYIFPDKYQLSAPNFLAANNLKGIRGLTTPPPDLEAPDWATEAWGSNMLLELAPPSSSLSAWYAEIPLHLRYLKPAPGGQQPVEVAWPAVFWACSSSDGWKMGKNPFDREGLGYEDVFGARTAYYHLSPSRSEAIAGEERALLVEEISVPVINENGFGYGFLQQGTAAVLLLGLAWVAYKLVWANVATKEAGGLKKLSERERVDSKGKKKAQ